MPSCPRWQTLRRVLIGLVISFYSRRPNYRLVPNFLCKIIDRLYVVSKNSSRSLNHHRFLFLLSTVVLLRPFKDAVEPKSFGVRTERLCHEFVHLITIFLNDCESSVKMRLRIEEIRCYCLLQLFPLYSLFDPKPT